MQDTNLKQMYKTTFNSVANGYEHEAMRFFSDTADKIPSFLNLKGDEHILDVATGTGLATFSLARYLHKGKIVGIDLSDGMLEIACQKQKELNITNINFIEMDMQELVFDDEYFDKVVASFSIFFVPDLLTQLKHIVQKVKPNGEILITTFFKDSFTPLVELLFERLERYGVEIPILDASKVNTKEQCEALFQDAGLKDIRCEVVDMGYYLESFEMWWYIVYNAGLRGFVDKLSFDELEQFKKEHKDEIEALGNKEGIYLKMNIIFTVGRKS